MKKAELRQEEMTTRIITTGIYGVLDLVSGPY